MLFYYTCLFCCFSEYSVLYEYNYLGLCRVHPRQLVYEVPKCFLLKNQLYSGFLAVIEGNKRFFSSHITRSRRQAQYHHHYPRLHSSSFFSFFFSFSSSFSFSLLLRLLLLPPLITLVISVLLLPFPSQ